MRIQRFTVRPHKVKIALLIALLTTTAVNASNIIVDFDLTDLAFSNGTIQNTFTASVGTLELTITAQAALENGNNQGASTVRYHNDLGLGVVNQTGIIGDSNTVRGVTYFSLDGSRGTEQMILSFNESVAIYSISFFDLPTANGNPDSIFAFESGGWTINEGRGPFDNTDSQNRFAFYNANGGGRDSNGDFIGNGAINELRNTGTDLIGGSFQNRIPSDDTLRITVGSDNVTIFLSGISVELTEEQATDFGIVPQPIPEPGRALFLLTGFCALVLQHRRRGMLNTRP